MPASALKPFGARLATLGVQAQQILGDIAACGVNLTDIPARFERKGAQHSDFEVLLRGWAFHFRSLRDGTRHIAGLILPGDPCNIDAVEFGAGNFRLGTLTSCVIGTVDGGAFRALCNRDPSVRRMVSLLAMAENAMLREWTLSVARRNATQRLAHLFCELQTRLTAIGEAAPDGFTLPLTQAHLAELTGLSTVHVNRTLQALRADGLVELANQRLRVPNWQALAALAEFNPDYLRPARAAAA